MNNKIISDNDFYCHMPFETLYVHAVPAEYNEKGYTFMSMPCLCFKSINRAITNKYFEFADRPLDLLFSTKRIDFLLKILNHDYSFCGKCPIYRIKDEQARWTPDDYLDHYPNETGKKLMESWYENRLKTVLPCRIALGLDESCNLVCKTCRAKPKPVTFNLTDFDIESIAYMSSKVTQISVGGDGELFAGRNYKKFLSQPLNGGILSSIDFFTNGTLFDEAHWNGINEVNQKLITNIRISVDAACKDTYVNLRGNHWDVLMKNLQFVNELKKSFGFNLYTNYTISTYNIADIEKFTDFAFSLGFDQIQYSFARSILHDELGKAETNFIIPNDARTDIIDFLSAVREKYGYDKIILYEAI